MALNLEDTPETVQMALDWSTLPRAGEVGVFDEDRDFVERLRQIVAAVIECNLARNPAIMKSTLMVLGYVSPPMHMQMLLSLGHEAPEAVTKAFRALARGTQSEQFAYASLVESFGRFARHGLFIDVMSDEEAIEEVRAAINANTGEKS